MKIVNIFSNGQHIPTLPAIDMLIWAAGLAAWKQLGYALKIYCEPHNLEFLDYWRLRDFYDEVDTSLLPDNEQIAKVDGKRFWSARKAEVLRSEIALGNDSVVADTDIIMFAPLPTDYDLLVWSDEPRTTNGGTIYLDWKQISTPPKYVMKRFVRVCKDAYNCGVLHFKDTHLYELWAQEYYRFVIGNPCKSAVDYGNNVFACNSEQRILRACADYMEARVAKVMPEKKQGLSAAGNHYYWLRAVWRNLPRIQNDVLRLWLTHQLKVLRDLAFKLLEPYPQTLERFESMEYFQKELTSYQ